MAADEVTVRATPKRKRGDNDVEITPVYTSAQFSFRLPDPKSDDDGSASPRTRVVQRFKGLNLDERGVSSSGGGVATKQLGEDTQPGPSTFQRSLGNEPTTGGQIIYKSDEDDDVVLTMRKRQKVPELEMRDVDTITDVRPTAPTATVTEATLTTNNPSSQHPEPQPEPEAIALKVSFSSATTPGTTELQRSYPSINRLQDSKSRGRRKRAGTPPLAKGRIKRIEDAGEDEVTEVVDPVRASLTWHENEITVYDPDDSDDDGTGVNGIGFKPTPALARIRTQKRRQQLLEYKKREDREARARRNERRRGSTSSASAVAAAQQAIAERRVRFTESGAATVITTS